jgi:hypothetical protein
MMPPPPPEAIELTHALDRALDAFAREHEALLRKACNVAPDVPSQKMRSVLVITMLGHVVSLVRRKEGNASVAQIVETLLEQLDECEPLDQLAENTH